MAESIDQSITVVCTCGKKLKAPASAVGRKARCKACGTVLTIQAPEPVGLGDDVDIHLATAEAAAATPAKPVARSAAPKAPVKRKEAEPEDDDPLGALYDLAKEEKRATVDNRPRCPQCVSELSPDAVICTNCGYNVHTGKALTTAKVAAEPKKPWFGKKSTNTAPSGKKVADAMAPQGSFMMGVVGCGIGGLVGGAIWFTIAWLTGYELGFIALVVGALSGLGMQIGQKGYSSLGGGVAALMAFLAIILAKAAVVIAVIVPLWNAAEELEDGDYNENVVDMMMEEEYAARKLDPEETSIEEDEAVHKAVIRKLKNTSKTEMAALEAKAEDSVNREMLEEDLVYEQLEKMKVDPDEANEAQVAIAEKAVADKVAAMTPAERLAEVKRLEAKFEAELAAEEAADEAEASAGGESDDEGASAVGGVALVGAGLLIYILIGGWKSILFLVLAVSLAYKTASGGVSD